METKRICPSCQKTLPPHVPLGLCPECLIKSGFNTGTEPGNPGKESGFVPPPVEELRKVFPQLEIIELIGKGGMGAVYKARQPTLDRFVALKILPPGAADDAGFAERFNREARALARLNHPHIVAVHDFGQAGGQPYLVMEFVDGLNLRGVEQAGRLTPEQALEIVPQICEALQFAHNEGVVHRDIKPENILLDKKGRVKITDFGIAKIVGVPSGRASLTGAKDVLGTPHYMAPEQVESPQTVDHRADIYSLGVVFYEMLTGELPLGKFQSPSKKVQMDVRLDEVVLHALAKEPERRYQHVSEVKTDVETIVHTSPPAPGSSQREEASSAGAHGRLPLAATRYNPWELAITVGGTTLLLALLLFATPNLGRPVNWLLIVICIIGLGICALVWAGLWPVRSALFPEPNFSSRNLRRRKEQPASRAEVEAARSQVRGPAIGLVVTGVLNWLAIPLTFLVTAGVVSQSEDRGSYMILIPLSAFVLSSVMIVAGLKMKRLEAHGLAIAGSILAMLITPGNVIGLPVGIWALVVLSHREVREAFGKGGSFLLESGAAAPPGPRPDRFWQRFAVAIALVLLALILIPVGAVLLSITLPALNRAKVKMQSKSEPAQLSMAFGPMIERIVNDLDENRGDEALNFRTGQLLSLPADFEQRTGSAREAWLNTNRVDLLVDYARDRWAILSRGMQFRDLREPDLGWGGVWPESEVLEKRENREGTLYLLPANAQPPLTFAFLTANGDQGVLHITGLFTNDPRGMKLRYKLTQLAGRGGGGIATASAPDLRNSDADSIKLNFPNRYLAAALAGMDLAAEKIKEAAARGELSEQADVFNHFNELCDQLQGKNRNAPVTPQDWGIQDADKFKTITDSIAALEDASERMRDIARSRRRSKAEREPILKEAANQFVNRYAEFKAQLNIATRSGGMSAAGQNAQRQFVRLVVDKTAMTFEGQPTTWEGVGALLAKVPDRTNTVLELAVTSDQITVAQQNEWFHKASALARQHGFEYASFIGIHPLGSKAVGSTSLPAKTSIAFDEVRAVALFNDIEDFGHEFDAAFTSTNLAAAQTGTRRLVALLTNFNAVVQGTGLEFPSALFVDIAKVRAALDEGDWIKARQLAQHNEEYARAFKRIASRMVELARQQQAKAGEADAAAISRKVPPVVIETRPSSGATDVDPGLTDLRVTFSKLMRDGGWSWTIWGEENYPEMTGQPRYLPDGRTCALPVKLKPGKLYAIWLNSEYHKDFTDTNGRPALPYLLIFQTRK